MRAVVFDKVGPPTEVLRLADVVIPEIGDDEVLVEMLAAPINPGDFLFIQNLYPEPKKPHFPEQIGGNYGVRSRTEGRQEGLRSSRGSCVRDPLQHLGRIRSCS